METSPFPLFPADADVAGRRLLLVGAPGTGKSTLARQLAARLASEGAPVFGLAADPGSPPFGLPGAVALGQWRADGWAVLAEEPLCSLDAGRFRLPLSEAVRRLVARAGAGTLLVDSPGVVRGTAGAELLAALAAAAAVDGVIVLYRDRLPLLDELRSLPVTVWRLLAAAGASRPGDVARARGRTRLWDDHLTGARDYRLPPDTPLMGTPPPREAPEAWIGRQVALLGEAPLLGEVVAADANGLMLRLPATPVGTHVLLVRDAVRDRDGLLRTAAPFGTAHVGFLAAPSAGTPREPGEGPVPVARVGPGTAVLVNGVLGDPLLHFRFTHRRRSLLFDLGEAGRLPARIAHQVTDVFVSHAHMDHFGGFLWLLRSRIGERSVCRLYGPPGLAANAAGMLAAVHWDRIGDRGPRFVVAELHGTRLRHFALQAGIDGPRPLAETEAEEGVVHAEPEFRVRAATLDHGTPVLAYCFEPRLTVHVRKERLVERGLVPGPWLGRLKAAVIDGDMGLSVDLPDGRREPVSALAADLLLMSRGEPLAYATDLADTPDNRARLTALAASAHTLFCEASFLAADAEQAARTGHLTATACGAIATAANVAFLVPFHFSRRYETELWRVYDEVRAACARTVVPRGPV